MSNSPFEFTIAVATPRVPFREPQQLVQRPASVIQTQEFAPCAPQYVANFPFITPIWRRSIGGSAMAIIDVKTEITGNVWKIVAEPGTRLEEDDPIMILESMKMEIPVSAPQVGTVAEILVEPEQPVSEGDVVARFEV